MSTKRRRQSVGINVTSGEASEDGDWVRLREIRQINATNKLTSVPEIETTQVDTEDVVPTIKSESSSVSKVAPNELESLRIKLLQTAANGDLSEFKNILFTIKAGNYIELSSPQMVDPETQQNLLHFCLENMQIDIAKYIIEEGNEAVLCQEYDTFATGVSGKKNALQKLTELGQYDLCKVFLSKLKSPDVRKRILYHETPFVIQGQRPRTFSVLHIAANLGSKSLVEFYLETAGMDVNLRNAKGDTALLWASRWGHIKAVRCLLKRKANPDLKNDKGSTALYWSVRYGHDDIVKILIKEGKADVNLQRKLGLVAPIIVACALGYNNIAKCLLKHGADANLCIRAKERPIHHACREGHNDILDTLLKYGVKLDEPDAKGDTGVLLAAKYGHVNVVTNITKRGADITHKNLDGRDAWYFAIESENDGVLKALVKCLQEARHEAKLSGAVNEALMKTRSPLCLAAINGACEKISLLLRLGLDPKEADDDGNTFIHCAAMNDQFEVIDKFYDKISVDSLNKYKETPLHLAAKYGYHETVEILLKRKAKSDIDNDRGETVLHVAAKSKKILPETAKLLIEYTIKTHAWDALNDPDNKHNNPLHVAAKHAREDVLWEFRFVKCKDKNTHGNTPMHDAVRTGEPEIFDTILDIFDATKRDANINETNGRKQTILHLAAMAGFCDSLSRLIQYGADLSVTDEDGNTVLHCLTIATVEDSQNAHHYLRSFDSIVEEVVRWWCLTRNHRYPDDNKDLYKEYKKDAMLFLSNDNLNNENLSVLSLAAKIAAADVLERLLMMDDVTRFKQGSIVTFDVTNITPGTNRSISGMCGANKVTPSMSCLEWLINLENPSQAARVLDIPPIRMVESNYGYVCAWTYAILSLVHILYMSIFSAASIGVLEELRIKKFTNATPSSTLSTYEIILYTVVPLEPAYLFAYTVYSLVRLACAPDAMLKTKLKLKTSKFRSIINMIEKGMPLLTNLAFATLVITWLILYSVSYSYQDYVLAISLCFGWLYTISFTRGLKFIHYFWRMLKNMIMRDVLRFVVFYSLVLVAFSFTLHALFQISPTISAQYPSPMSTMFLVFNMMVGMGDLLFDDAFDQEMASVQRSTVFSKLIYLLYIAIATIVLLNLLIAMMNDSYQEILRQQQVRWRLDSVRLGVEIEKTLPFSTKLFSKVQIENGLAMNADESVKRWYIRIPKHQLASYVQDNDTEIEDMAEVITARLDDLEKKVDHSTKQMHDKLEEMQRFLIAHFETSSEKA